MLLLQQCYPCIRPNRFTETKFFDPSSTNIYCELHFGPGPDQSNLGQENRATTLGMTAGRVRAGFFHTPTQTAGLPQKPRLDPFIKQIFFLTPNLARRAPTGPASHATIWAQTMALSQKKKIIYIYLPDSLFLKMCLPDSFQNVFAHIQGLNLGKHFLFIFYFLY